MSCLHRDFALKFLEGEAVDRRLDLVNCHAFSSSHGEIDLKIRFSIKFFFRCASPEVSTSKIIKNMSIQRSEGFKVSVDRFSCS